MADGFAAKDATGATVIVLSDEVTDASLGGGLTGQKQLNGIVDGTVGSTNKLVVNAAGRIGVESPVGKGHTLVPAAIDVAASGDNTLVAATAAQKIYVVSYVIVAAAAVNARFKSGTNNISGAMALAANGGIALAGAPDAPLLVLNTNEALIVNLSAAVQLSGHLVYFKE